jgi:hypothetical protein
VEKDNKVDLIGFGANKNAMKYYEKQKDVKSSILVHYKWLL